MLLDAQWLTLLEQTAHGLDLEKEAVYTQAYYKLYLSSKGTEYYNKGGC